MDTTWSQNQLSIRNNFAEFGHRVADRASNSRKERQFDLTSWKELAASGFFRPSPAGAWLEGVDWWTLGRPVAVEGWLWNRHSAMH